eukprot:4094385-Pleurochrysis_carterae.AAC.1
MSQTCQYRHSPNQSLVAQNTGSATGSDHSIYAAVVCKISSNVHDHVRQIKGPGVRNQVVPGLSWDTPGALRGAVQGFWRACMPPTLLCKVLLSYKGPRTTQLTKEVRSPQTSPPRVEPSMGHASFSHFESALLACN